MGRGRLQHTTTIVSRMRRTPPQFTTPVIILRCLGEALRESLHHHRHHAIVLTELIYYLDTLLDQEGKGRHQAERVQNAELLCVRYLIGCREKKFDYINRVVKRFHLPSTRVRRHTLPLVAICISMDRSLCVRRIFLFSIQRSPTVASEPSLCVDDMHD